MRNTIRIQGILYYPDDVRRYREAASGIQRTAEGNLQQAAVWIALANEIEAALNAPEPLVAGDIVEYAYAPQSRLVVLGGAFGDIIETHYQDIVGPVEVRATNGAESYSGRASLFTKVGNLREVK